MYRALLLILAVVGSVIVFILLLAGHDPHQAARSGPGWKRRLVAAGLAVLGMLGMTSGCGQGHGTDTGAAASNTDASTTEGQQAGKNEPPIDEAQRRFVEENGGKPLEETNAWRQVAGTLQEAEDISSGKRGSYPFDETGQEKILADLATAKGTIDRLKRASLLTTPEAELLKKELARLTSSVRAIRPVEMRNATCYAPHRFRGGHESLERLEDRLPLIEKLAGSGTLPPRVVSKVLGTIEADIATIENKSESPDLSDSERAEAEKTCMVVKSHVERIRRALKADAAKPVADKP